MKVKGSEAETGGTVTGKQREIDGRKRTGQDRMGVSHGSKE